MNQNNAEKLDKILGDPFYGDLPENGLKVRRNLLACSSISILLVLSGAKFDPSPTIFGFKFTDVPNEVVPVVLFILSLYFFVHFLSYAAEALVEWRIRLTGQSVVPYTGGDILAVGDPSADGSLDPRQSTLYSWWFTHRSSFHSASDIIRESIKTHDRYRAEIEARGAESQMNVSAEIAKLDDIARKLNFAADKLAQLTPRLFESLKRFDAWKGFSLRAQSLRWLAFDLALPVCIGLVSLYLLFQRAFLAC